MDQKHIEAYQKARYYIDSLNTFLLIGHSNFVVDDWLEKKGRHTAYFITASNPESKLTNENINDVQNEKLEKQLKGHIYLKGRGADPTGKWPSEDSFLVTSIEEDKISQLMQAFDQYAYVRYIRNKVAELKAVNP